VMEAEGIEPGVASFCRSVDRLTGQISGNDAEDLVRSLEGAVGDDPTLRSLLDQIRRRSPTSLEAIVQAQRRARSGLSLLEVLADDLKLARFAIRQPDFLEGVRAVLVHKDGAPRWNPGALSERHRVAIFQALSTS
jgi:enoyl-CoA hydratase